MEFTISQLFEEFKSNLEITDLQTTTVSVRQGYIRSVIEREMKIRDSFLTGSYTRNTMIAPLQEADIDIFFVLDSSYFYKYNKGQNGGQAGLLDYVKRVLRKTYTKTPDISRNGQAVTIRFNDFVVDVIPGFERLGGGYLIPNAIKCNWISTDPKQHIKIMSDRNKYHHMKLKPLIKMIKCWNRNNNKYFNSFHLEVLAVQILDGVIISNFSSGVRYYFDKGRMCVSQQNLDPAGYGGDVGNYLNTNEKNQEAVSKFELAYDRAIEAEYCAIAKDICQAVHLWKKIFGDYFPSYE